MVKELEGCFLSQRGKKIIKYKEDSATEKLYKIIVKYIDKNGKNPSNKELSTICGVTEKLIHTRVRALDVADGLIYRDKKGNILGVKRNWLKFPLVRLSA
tara:strand:+ start:300 stop:599 length:300 start_codon:yes stop_codon:yes gene_type:complete